MARNKRLRAVIVAGCALAVVAGVGVGVAFASPSGRPRYVTAAATTGDVTQTYTASGTVTRTNTVTAGFAVDGTVSSVKVAVGDTVDAGEVLAVLKKGPLQLAVLDAETSVAEAKATLYSAQHPSSTTRSGGATNGSSVSSAAKSSGGSASSGGSSSGSKASAGVTIDPTALLKITEQLTAAVAAETKACEPVLGPVPTPSTSPSPTTSPSPSGSPSPSEEPSASESASPTPSESASPEPSESASPKPSESPTSSSSASVKDQADVIERNDPTDAELKACGEARAQVQLATNTLQQTVQQLVKPGGGSGGRPSGSSTGRPSGSASTGSGSSNSASSTPTVSAAQVASAKAKLLQAEQELQSAQDDLDNAELVAPISGKVGTVGLTTGASASSGSITIVGDGNARVTFELPLKTRALVKAGQKVNVTPAGSSKVLTGTLTGISAIETSGTAGDAPTYSTIVTVSDSGGLLASGARASVSIPVKTATKVVRVPVSAVTPTGSGTGTVQVVTDARAESASSVDVTTGAVGGGWIEITQGVNAGDLVVLADNTAALPTNSNGRRTTTTSTRATASASAAPSGAATPGGAAPDGAQPSTAPSATPTR